MGWKSLGLRIRLGLRLAFVLGVLGVTSACFNNLGAKKPTPSSQTFPILSSAPPSQSNGLYSCPTSPNVVPSYDRRLDGSGYFRVCRHQTNNADIKIHGQAYSTSGICIFPIQYMNAQNIYAKPDVRTGAPWSQCHPLPAADPEHLEETGVYSSFPGINWNAVIIVDPLDNLLMRECLALGQLSRCPDYSLGKFRD